MNSTCFAGADDDSLPVYLISKDDVESGNLEPPVKEWIGQTQFRGSEGEFQLLPGADGVLAGALFGVGGGLDQNPFAAGTLARKLPAGNWHLENAGDLAFLTALGFGLGSYHFDRYKKREIPKPKLVCEPDGARAQLDCILRGCNLARDLVNTPVNDMGPDELEKSLRDLAGEHSAKVKSVHGDALLDENFPMIHAVGRASSSAPRLLDLTWGREDAPKVTLIGKGVCFDTGGLDIKPAAGMLLMK
ncbi:hypothetical protein [Hoeflea sp.]|uniref:hypothetical protein n=1 Tax=Hoeflea sp. TaxID=1940281 RepID=UPI003B02EC6D